MVLQNVARRARISRREVADLRRIEPQKAYRLLRRLTASGRLRRVGGVTKERNTDERAANRCEGRRSRLVAASLQS
jgi:hypothetical protein